MNKITRLILIDAYKSADIVTVNLDGNTNLNGDNGSGKTTLLKIVPAFYGASPGQIIRKVDGVTSFVDYYLRNPISYIIFEYEKENEKKLIVISRRNPAEKTAQYRFINSGYQKKLFYAADDDLHKVVTSAKLGSHLKLLGVEFSGVLGSEDYKLVIQNNTLYSRGKDRHKTKLINQYRRLYSLCKYGTSMENIDLITTAILERSPSIDGIKEIIKTILTNTEAVPQSHINLEISPITLERWTASVESHRIFEEKLDEIMQLKVIKADYEAAVSKLNEVEALAKALDESLQDQLIVIEQEINASLEKRECKNNELNNALNHHQKVSSDFKHEIETKQTAIQQLLVEQQDWENKNIDQLKALVTALPQLQQAKVNAENQYQQLIEGAKDLDLQYDHLVKDKQSEYQNNMQSLELKTNQADVEKGQLELACSEQFYQKKERIKADHLQQLDGINQQLEKLSETKGRLSSQVNFCGAPEKLLEDKNQLDDQIQRAHDNTKNLNQAIKTIDQKRIEQIRQQQGLQKEYAEKKREKVALENHQQHLRKLLLETDNTLLNFLRHNHPQWVDNIAKIVPEAVLLRRDLQPELVDVQHNSLYGVGLDLSVIESQRAASDSELKNALRKLDAEWEALNQEISGIEKQDKEARSVKNKLEKELQNAEQSLLAHDQQILQIKKNLADIKSMINLAIEEKKLTLQQEVETVENEISGLKHQQSEIKIVMASQIQQLSQDEKIEKQAIEAKISTIKVKIASELELYKNKFEQDLEQLERERHGALNEEGIDAGTLRSIRDELEEIKIKISQAQQGDSEVKEYGYWLAHQWVNYTAWTEACEQLEWNLEKQHNQWQQTKHELDQAIKAINKTGSEVKAKHSHTERQRVVLQRILGQLDTIDYRSEPSQVTLSSVHTVEWLNQYLNSSNQNRKQWLDQGKLLYNQIIRAMRFYNHSVTDQFATRMESEITLVNQELTMNWYYAVDKLSDYAQSGHQENESQLLSQVMMHGQSIVDYYDTLEDIDKKINSIGKKITKRITMLSENLDEISDLKVNITSTLNTLNYWSPLKHFRALFHQWRARNPDQLPESELIEQLKNITHIITQTGLSVSIIKHFDVEITLINQGERTSVHTDSGLRNVSSTGLSYLIIIMIYTAMANMLRGHSDTALTWVVDELKNFSEDKVDKIMTFLAQYNIYIFSAFPDPDPDILKNYDYKYYISKDRSLSTYKDHDDEDLYQSLIAELNQDSQTIDFGANVTTLEN